MISSSICISNHIDTGGSGLIVANSQFSLVFSIIIIYIDVYWGWMSGSRLIHNSLILTLYFILLQVWKGIE